MMNKRITAGKRHFGKKSKIVSQRSFHKQLLSIVGTPSVKPRCRKVFPFAAWRSLPRRVSCVFGGVKHTANSIRKRGIISYIYE
jgi:hypothetical protein